MNSRGTGRRTWICLATIAFVAFHTAVERSCHAENPSALAGSRPNIVLIITDDQGYGELGCHGNPTIQTPNLDRLHAESTRFTAFHVSPTCAPTRASIMTGQHEFRNGVTHTIMQRERLAPDATTLAEVLHDAGYETGIFGKWHLGDEKPYRPAQRGFKESFIHGAGGIGQSYEGSCGDFPKNSYFDPYVLHNERVEKTSGYCTDVFFREAAQWIEVNRDRPFYAQIATNAPHSPYICPPGYDKQYREAGLDEQAAAYYGMITNIDENVGRLLQRLDELNLANRTLVIFMTDNGHALGHLYNAGMRGKKGTAYEGGTRVPAFFRWPGKIKTGVDVTSLAAAIDLFPTIAEICGAPVPDDIKLEGRSLVLLLEHPKAEWPDRYLFTHLGRWETGKVAGAKFAECAVRSKRFRLINNRELFDIQNDPGEQQNVIDDYPEIVADMRRAYDEWWDSAQPRLVNEDVPFAEENAFATLYREQVDSKTPPAVEAASVRGEFIKTALTPFWRATEVRDPMFFVQEKDSSTATARLLYKPSELITVESATRETKFRPETDFVADLSAGTVTVTKDSKIPVMSQETLYPLMTSDGPKIGRHGGDTTRGIFFGEGAVYHNLQAEAVYRLKPGQWKGPKPRYVGDLLPKSVAKLRDRKPFHLMLCGDSISAGANASLLSKTPPECPPCGELTALALEHHFGSRVIFTNHAVVGWASGNGLQQAREQRIGKQQPDLVIIAFGMNDVFQRDASVYQKNIRDMMDTIRADAPDADFILVASMLGNAEWGMPMEQFPLYRDALAKLCGPGVALADMTSMWEALLKRKSFYDLTGNGVNHPNDFGHCVYAQSLLAMLIEK